jgi:hypothetical protein
MKRLCEPGWDAWWLTCRRPPSTSPAGGLKESADHARQCPADRCAVPARADRPHPCAQPRPGLVGFDGGTLGQLPFVTTYHGAYKPRTPLKRWYNSVMARGDAVIANSQFTADSIASQYPFARDTADGDPARHRFARYDGNAQPYDWPVPEAPAWSCRSPAYRMEGAERCHRRAGRSAGGCALWCSPATIRVAPTIARASCGWPTGPKWRTAFIWLAMSMRRAHWPG